MRMFVGVRLPEELVKQMDSRTENRSAMIVAALESYLGPRTDPRPTKTEAEAIKKVAERVRTEKQPEPKAPKQPERPKAEVVRQCPRCGDRDKVISWGSMDRCTRCGMNF